MVVGVRSRPVAREACGLWRGGRVVRCLVLVRHLCVCVGSSRVRVVLAGVCCACVRVVCVWRGVFVDRLCGCG